MVAFPQQITRTICIANYPALPTARVVGWLQQG